MGEGDFRVPRWKIENREPSFPYYSPPSIRNAKRTYFVLEASLSSSLLEGLDNPVLVISGMFAQAFEVSLEDKLIARVGDFSRGDSNIWNRAFIVPLLDNAVPGKKLRIKALSLFEFGLNRAPFLASYKDARIYVGKFNFLLSDLTLLEMGVILAIGFMLLGIAFSAETRLSSFYGSLGVAFILAFIGQMDMVFFEKLPISLLFFKKIVDFSLYLALIIWYLSMRNFFEAHENSLRKFLKLTLISFWLAGLVFIWDLRILRFFDSLFVFLLLLVSVDMFIFSAKGFQKAPSISLVNLFVAGTGFVNALVFLVDFFGKPVIPYLQAINMGTFVMGVCVGVEMIRDFAFISRDYKKVREKSMRDELTGAYNRTVLANLEGREAFSILFIDVDNLKEVNDRYGHEAGDQLLIAIAAIIKGRIRKGDALIRYGGDEFVVLLKDCDERDAIRIARGIIEEVRKLEFPFSSTFQAGVSIGVSSRRESESLRESLIRADRALYSAKRRGKGRALLVD